MLLCSWGRLPYQCTWSTFPVAHLFLCLRIYYLGYFMYLVVCAWFSCLAFALDCVIFLFPLESSFTWLLFLMVNFNGHWLFQHVKYVFIVASQTQQQPYEHTQNMYLVKVSCKDWLIHCYHFTLNCFMHGRFRDWYWKNEEWDHTYMHY